MTKKEINRKEFSDWLRSMGADVQATTSPYEFARFRAHGAVQIVYRRQNGAFSSGEFGMECLAAFTRGTSLAMGFTGPRHGVGAHLRAALVERDGDACFFCGMIMPREDMTIEHLVAKNKGGPDHTDNLVLAHEKCNQSAGAAPLIDKIRIHVQMQIKKQGSPA
jgi:hypothetical protein